MDQLQNDATVSYALSRRLKRRDSAKSSGSSESIRQKTPQDADASQRSSYQSTPFNISASTGITQLPTVAASTLQIGCTNTYQTIQGLVNNHAIGPRFQAHGPEHLMLCFDRKGMSQRLEQITIHQPPATNAEFFHRLQTDYYLHRQPKWGLNPFWRKVTGIHFVRFLTCQPTGFQSIRIVDLDSLPPIAQVGWIRSFSPEVQPRPLTMLGYMKHPSTAGVELNELSEFSQIPRKLYGRIPSRSGQVGWGLYFCEGLDWALVCGLLAGVVATVILVAYSTGE